MTQMHNPIDPRDTELGNAADFAENDRIEAANAVNRALEELYRVHGNDEAAVGEVLHEGERAARLNAATIMVEPGIYVGRVVAELGPFEDEEEAAEWRDTGAQSRFVFEVHSPPNVDDD